MSEVLSIEEIKKQYDKQWVLLSEIEVDPGPILRAGRVIFHSRNKSDVQQKATELSLKRSAFIFVGTAPDNVMFAL